MRGTGGFVHVSRYVFRSFLLSVAVGCCALSGCSSMGDATIGGRPMIYKQGSGDAAATIDNKTGAVSKRDSREEVAQAPVKTASSSTTASSSDKGVLSGVSKPQWAVEQ